MQKLCIFLRLIDYTQYQTGRIAKESPMGEILAFEIMKLQKFSVNFAIL